jgi:hypothetical protein
MVLGILGGCSTYERTHLAALPAEGVQRVFGDVERGAIGYVGAPDADTFDLGVRDWAHAGGAAAAERRMDSSEWGLEIRGEVLDLWARSPDRRAGVDFVVYGPSELDVELVVLDGLAEVHGVRGEVVVTAPALLVRGAEGSLDVLATEGHAEVEAFPGPADTLRVEALEGDVVLALPYGAPITLRVDADPAWGVTVTDLGFDSLDAGPGHVDAVAGDGSISVDVVVEGGSFTLWQASEPEELP